MKHSINFPAMKSFLSKVLFSSQLIIISAAVPVLYCIAVTHNPDAKKTETILIKTNKGGQYEKAADAKTDVQLPGTVSNDESFSFRSFSPKV